MLSVITVIAIAFLLLSIVVSAQSRVSQQERLKNLRERLNLTEEQYTKVEKILTKSYDDILNFGQVKIRTGKNSGKSETNLTRKSCKYLMKNKMPGIIKCWI